MQSNKAFFQKSGLQISITVQSEMNYGKIIRLYAASDGVRDSVTT